MIRPIVGGDPFRGVIKDGIEKIPMPTSPSRSFCRPVTTIWPPDASTDSAGKSRSPVPTSYSLTGGNLKALCFDPASYERSGLIDRIQRAQTKRFPIYDPVVQRSLDDCA